MVIKLIPKYEKILCKVLSPNPNEPGHKDNFGNLCYFDFNKHKYFDSVTSHFNHPSVYMPSVTKVEIHCSPYNDLEKDYTKFGSLPNLEKLVLIQRDNTGFSTAFLDIHNIISTFPTKKLKHIILKNMSTWIIAETIDKAKLFAQVNNIKLEII